MIRSWINQRLHIIAPVVAMIGMFLWSWWLIHHLNGWAATMNQYIHQTDGRLERIEEQLIRFEYLDRQQAATERNA